MLPDRVSNPGPLTYESGALPIALRGPAVTSHRLQYNVILTLCARWVITIVSVGVDGEGVDMLYICLDTVCISLVAISIENRTRSTRSTVITILMLYNREK